VELYGHFMFGSFIYITKHCIKPFERSRSNVKIHVALVDTSDTSLAVPYEWIPFEGDRDRRVNSVHRHRTVDPRICECRVENLSAAFYLILRY
jgi:hypothetical protein